MKGSNPAPPIRESRTLGNVKPKPPANPPPVRPPPAPAYHLVGPSVCGYCGQSFRPHDPERALYCSDKCRAAHHREKAPRGRVTAMRLLSDGGAQVTVRFPKDQTPQALRLRVGEGVIVGEAKERLPDGNG